MKKMTVNEFKTHFSEVINQVKSGEQIAVTYGKKKETIGYFISALPPQPKRKLGILEGKAKFVFHDDFKICTDEFLSL